MNTKAVGLLVTIAIVASLLSIATADVTGSSTNILLRAQKLGVTDPLVFNAPPTIAPSNTPTLTPTVAPCRPAEVTGESVASDTPSYSVCSPYIVTGNVVVAGGVTLAIESGVTVKFESDKGLQVNGTLKAQGTSDNPDHLHIQ